MRQPTSPTSFGPLTRLVLAAAALLVLPSLASADQILETHDATLTTYLSTAKSNIQDIRALVDQRGVNLDGSLRQGSTHRMSLAGNPFGDSWSRNQTLSGVRLDTGTFLVSDVDLAFPAEIPWVIGRSYNSRQKDSGGSYYASTGYQGKNWFQNSQPELVFYNSETDAEDVIYLIYGADRFIEFKRGTDGEQASADTFKAVNGAAGAILIHTFDTCDLATYYDQNGMRFDFFWFADAQIDDDIEGSLWRIMDPSIDVDPYDTGDRLVTTDGNVAYVGDVGNPNTALSSGYDSSTGAITAAYDSAGRRFTYTYTSSMLAQVKAEVNTGSWVEVGKVDYGYYIAADSHGEANDLELVTVTMPLTDSGVSSVEKTYYWYYEGSYDATTNPGYHHQLQYVISAEGYRKYDWTQDSLLDDDTQSAAENDVKPYASAFFKYDTERRVKSAWFTGACGCSGAASGTHNFEYETNGGFSDTSGYDTTWKSRTIVEKPQVTYKTASPVVEGYVTQYFDEVGQPLHRVNTSDDPDNTGPAPSFWATYVTRNDDNTNYLYGQVTDISSPANVTAYTHSSASFTTSTSAGLVTTFTRLTSGDMRGFVTDTKHKTGTSGSAYLDGTSAYTSRDVVVGDVNLTRPFVSSRRVYSQEITSGTTGSYLTSWSYTFWSGASSAVQYLAPKIVTKTNPTVSTGNNGSNSATTEKSYLRKDGSTAFAEDAASSFTYTFYSDGQLTKRIDDAKTDHSGDFTSDVDPNGTYSVTETSTGVRRVTTIAYDSQGRSSLTTQADGRELKRYYSKLKDGRLVTLGYNDYDASPLKFYGPVQYTVVNQAGRAEVQATVALASNESSDALTAHIDENDGDPITAMDLGTVARLSVSIHDESGSVIEESRVYFDVPGSGSGTDGTNYDATLYGYDDQGRRVRTEAPHGTITRTDYDTLGRAVKQWTGTNDNAFDGGESSGTDNMVKTVESEFDSGGDKGNSYLTKRTFFVEDSTTDKRETTLSNDVRGRTLLQTNPEAPHVFNKFDNMGHLIASGLFSGVGSIVVGTDDPTTETANRLGLSQSFYDELGRVWKSQRHKIDDADGSDDDNLQSLTWRDAVGRTIKVDGAELAKTAYDRLGRQTHQYVLAYDNDSAYADADDVSGDIVLVESQTTYESTDSDDVLMHATISRFHDDFGGGETTGALDTNADGDALMYTAANIEGRIQITASWFDRFGRATDTVQYGTYGGSDFDRDGLSVPSRSDTALLSEYEHNTDGSLKSVVDPKALETRYEYDDLGRQVTVITNYVDGSPSGDSDTYTRNVYTDGLRTKFWLDIDGDNDYTDGGAQVTTYTYGTTKGTSAGDSKISTGHLLQKIAYPDSSGGSDVVKFAHNAQGQEIWKNHQEGTILETGYDDSGRTEHHRVTAIASGLDTAVRRITSAYDNLGRTQTVTQYDDERVGYGSVVNEVKYTFDDWGPPSKFEQDHNSAVGGTLLYDIDYAYGKSTTGRNTIRRNSLALPNNKTVYYRYGSGANDKASRVAELKVELTAVADYDYNGVNQVVGLDYPESDVFMHRFGSTSGTYPALDRFDRVTSSTWTKDLSTDRDFYDLDVTYDRNSNITLVEDNVHTGFDVEFALDGQNRLTNAQEGTWNGSSITSQTREQEWTDLDKAGNWDRAKLNLNSDADYTDTNEYDDDRTHNDVNEITGRLSGTYAPTWDAAGRLTDDKANYEYKYDAFSRLRQVLNTTNQAVVAEYTYNGLGYRIGWHYDVDTDGDVDSNDEWYRFIYDERWRIVATYRESDSSPKEQFVYHTAGADGLGDGSYIDDVVLRDKDANTAWDAASDGTLEERVYYCQSWRHDVVALIDDSGGQVEQARYLSYGIPFGLPFGDADSDGDHDGTDESTINGWVNTSTYDVRGDVDLDGDVDNTDYTGVTGVADETLAFGILSRATTANRKGYAAYELESAVTSASRLYHVRHRVMNADLGSWITRDPAEYMDLPNFYAYTGTNPSSRIDPSGLYWEPPACAERLPGNPGLGGSRGMIKKVTSCGFLGSKVKITVGCVVCGCNGWQAYATITGTCGGGVPTCPAPPLFQGSIACCKYNALTPDEKCMEPGVSWCEDCCDDKYPNDPAMATVCKTTVCIQAACELDPIHIPLSAIPTAPPTLTCLDVDCQLFDFSPEEPNFDLDLAALDPSGL